MVVNLELVYQNGIRKKGEVRGTSDYRYVSKIREREARCSGVYRKGRWPSGGHRNPKKRRRNTTFRRARKEKGVEMFELCIVMHAPVRSSGSSRSSETDYHKIEIYE